MNVILNELSICGQYEDIQAFEDMVAEDLGKIISIKDICIHKKMDIYARMLTPEVSLYMALRRANQTASTFLKKTMVGPYWDEETQYEQGKLYEYPGKSEEPNGVTEAMDREWPLLSLQGGGYEDATLETRKDGREITLDNIRSREKALELLLAEDVENVQYVIENYPYEKPVRLKSMGKNCYALKALLENNLTKDDICKFVRHLSDVIRDKGNGVESHWYKQIDGNLHEYRVTVSNDRELRVFFAWEQELILLNGFIKKQQKTPAEEIRRAKEIMGR